MNSVEKIICPRFAEGDLLIFSFEGAELILPSMAVPNNPDNIDHVSLTRNLKDVSTSEWRVDNNGNKYHRLLWQQWNIEDSTTLDDVALCKLYVLILELAESQFSADKLLSYSRFEKCMLEYHEKTFNEDSESNLEFAETPRMANRFFSRPIEREPINWLVSQLPISSGLAPVELVALPINNRFALMAHVEVESLHYAGRTNPYSNELLKQFEQDLFEDFLSHIKIEYSPETIATINSLKTKTPA